MNYEKIYNSLMVRACNRTTSGYVEKHHIIPRCMGGDETEQNIVKLYPEEHYLAHLLLCQIYKGNYKLLYAAMNMATGSLMNNGKRNNKSYGWVRKRYAESISGNNNPSRRNSNLQKEAAKKRVGLKRTEATKLKISQSQIGRKLSPEHRAKLSIAASTRRPRPFKHLSEETKAKISSSRKGSVASIETRLKMSKARKGVVVSDDTRKKMSNAAKVREENKRIARSEGV